MSSGRGYQRVASKISFLRSSGEKRAVLSVIQKRAQINFHAPFASSLSKSKLDQMNRERCICVVADNHGKNSPRDVIANLRSRSKVLQLTNSKLSVFYYFDLVCIDDG